MRPQLMGRPAGEGGVGCVGLSGAFSSSMGYLCRPKQINKSRNTGMWACLRYLFYIYSFLSDLPAEEICDVDSVTLPYPLITLQPRIILQNENKQLLPATEPMRE